MDTSKQLLEQYPDAIAIVGMAGRFSGAADIAAFWDLLRTGSEARREYRRDELIANGADPAVVDDPAYVRAGMPLDGPECFDAGFFGVSDKQAHWMDPQIRVFLEVCWHAMEDAGYDVSRLGTRRVGVFAGSNPGAYLWRHLIDRMQGHNLAQWLEILTYNDKDYLTTWVSYKLGLRGPSMNIQTACSTSLVAVATACQNLLGYQCDMALAGAAALSLPDGQGYLHQPDTILSPDGHCRPFDADGAGTIMGNGVAAVVLKRLEDAIADNDRIDALILGAAVNNDAQRKMDFMAPGVEGQVEVIRLAHRLADVTPDSIDYVETHGTGTRLGDPIEWRALRLAFGEGRERERRCAVGAVKSNLGHLNTAAGVAGLIKTVLALRHEMLPATLHYRRPNPQLELENSPFFVNDVLRPWPRGPRVRRAGVSAFGFGGTNAHLVIQEGPDPGPQTAPAGGAGLFVLSARDAAGLERYRAAVGDWLGKAGRSAQLADLCFTAARGRKVFSHRLAVVARNVEELAAGLSGASGGRATVEGGKTAWIFSGQGGQYDGMARTLYLHESAFREAFDACVAALPAGAELPLAEWLSGRLPMGGALQSAATLQPLLFAVQYGLAASWRRAGSRPDVLLGHSLGEYVAACLAGVMTLPVAMAMVCARGRLLDSLPAGGGMLAARLSREAAQAWLDRGFGLDIAADNGPEQVVLSGGLSEIARLADALTAAGVQSVRLPVTHAFHSALLDPVLDRFEAELSGFAFRAPTLPLLSNLDGTVMREAPDARYWREHLRRCVAFRAMTGRLAEMGVTRALEIGPRPLLSGLVGPVLPQGCLAALTEGPDAHVAWLGQVGLAFTEGYLADVCGVCDTGRRTGFPGYPFARTRFGLTMAVAAGQGGTPPAEDVADSPQDSGDPLFDLVAGYWRDALGQARLSRSSDFFMLGGNSLAAIQIRAAILRDLDIDLPMADMMKMRTLGDVIDAIAAVLEAESESEVTS
ncbi:type I polyketide synthase [Paludibacterium paludis]|nr:type I polyketide synthase [Paludibacterium paludis]